MEGNNWRSMAGVRQLFADDRPIKYLKEEEKLNSSKFQNSLTNIAMMESTVGFCLKRNVVAIQFETIETDLRNGLGSKLRILDLRQAQFLVAKLGN